VQGDVGLLDAWVGTGCVWGIRGSRKASAFQGSPSFLFPRAEWEGGQADHHEMQSQVGDRPEAGESGKQAPACGGGLAAAPTFGLHSFSVPTSPPDSRACI
jgi:hypothetical protein